jgi:hypothetical protein
MPGKTKGGLTIQNYSRYNTDDIVALCNAIEKRRFGKGPVVFSPFVVNNTLRIYQASGELKPEMIVRPGHMATRPPFSKAYGERSSRPASIKVCHPNRVFTNPLQSLVSDEFPFIPTEALLDLIGVLHAAYPATRYSVNYNGYEEFRIRIMPKLEDKKPREMRRDVRRKVNKDLNHIDHALWSVTRMLQSHAAYQPEDPAAMARFRDALHDFLEWGADLRDQLKPVRHTILLDTGDTK